jgi:alkaline phosphatase D
VKFTRREVIVTGAAAGLAACGPPAPQGPRKIVPVEYDAAQSTAFEPETVAEAAALFPMGIQAGAVRQDGALLWTRLEGLASTRLRVWRDAADGNMQLAKDVTLTPDAKGYVRTNIDGLAPATWYDYGFFDEALGQRTALGRFRTAYPDDWKEPMLFAASACTNRRMQPWVALSATATQNPDLFLHLGDISYNDSATVADEFRALWKNALTDPGYRALLTKTGWYAVWDDHEIANDLDPEMTDPVRMATAKDSFFENIAQQRGDHGELWRSYSWGGTAEFFLLDCRTERKPSTIGTPDAQYLSRAQLDWFKGALKASKAHFKVVLNSVPITRFPPPLWGVQNDRWQAYEAQREELLNFIVDENIEHVLFMSGDFHLGLVMRIEKEGPRRRMWEIAAGPGGNSGNPLSLVWESPDNRPIAFPRGQFVYCGGTPAATTVALNPKDNTVTVKFIDPVTEEVRFEQVLTEAD